jgi:glycine/D-amino acid oxidase-like deaminating enzyme
MAGIAAAYYLAVRHQIKKVVLVDERAPLTLTSDKGTAAYRNWFPGPGDAMMRLMNRSIDLLEELADASDNSFQLNRRGYVFLTAKPERIPVMQSAAHAVCGLGAGQFRRHHSSETYVPSPAEGFHNLPTGADLIVDRDAIFELFPFVTKDVVAMLHIRRAGFFDAMRLGSWLLNQARAAGVQLCRDRVERVRVVGSQVQAIHLQSGEEIATNTFVIAAGPYIKDVAALLGVDLPVFCELHAKVAIDDPLRIVPQTVPLMLWNDPEYLAWDDAERAEMTLHQDTRCLLEEFPAGVHFRPRDGKLLGLWTYDIKTQEPATSPTFDPNYGEVVLRGLARMIPRLSAYFGRGRAAYVDGGYYCKTRENRPLIGPLPVRGAYIIGALSGFGVMGSQAAAELLAAHITARALPDYASSFLLERYADPTYQALFDNSDQRSGQL